jgi:hypothetical protein
MAQLLTSGQCAQRPTLTDLNISPVKRAYCHKLQNRRLYGSWPQRPWSPQSRHRARKLLTIEDGVVNVWPELPEHKGHSIERDI